VRLGDLFRFCGRILRDRGGVLEIEAHMV
jgi:hypothetical protein